MTNREELLNKTIGEILLLDYVNINQYDTFYEVVTKHETTAFEIETSKYLFRGEYANKSIESGASFDLDNFKKGIIDSLRERLNILKDGYVLMKQSRNIKVSEIIKMIKDANTHIFLSGRYHLKTELFTNVFEDIEKFEELPENYQIVEVLFMAMRGGGRCLYEEYIKQFNVEIINLSGKPITETTRSIIENHTYWFLEKCDRTHKVRFSESAYNKFIDLFTRYFDENKAPYIKTPIPKKETPILKTELQWTLKTLHQRVKGRKVTDEYCRFITSCFSMFEPYYDFTNHKKVKKPPHYKDSWDK